MTSAPEVSARSLFAAFALAGAYLALFISGGLTWPKVGGQPLAYKLESGTCTPGDGCVAVEAAQKSAIVAAILLAVAIALIIVGLLNRPGAARVVAGAVAGLAVLPVALGILLVIMLAFG